MSNCCGQGRAAIVRAGVPTPDTAFKSAVKSAFKSASNESDIRLRLDRPLDLTLRGSVTGRDYHFKPDARSLRVAAADVDGLMRCGGLVRES